jgi:hypothetical protein
MERIARFVSVGSEQFGFARRPATIPLLAVKDMRVAWSKPVPRIRGIVRTPVFSAEGYLSTTRGYQAETGLFYDAAGDRVPDVPAAPTAIDVGQAKAAIDEWLDDFPFDSRASGANAIAVPLTYVARELIGKTPLFVINAPTQGTGKGLLADTASIVMEGREAEVKRETLMLPMCRW